tara:strand:- start:1926 stop:2360 length:435 start_codon:yes stop_codon:yes gene_type:complete
MKSDYLKYYRVVRQFIKKKYKLTQAELDVLLFLRSEEYFSKDKFNEFDELLSWDVNRFDKLRRDKWIEVFRKRMGNRKALYMLSNKSKRVVNSIYKKLNGEEIPTSNDGNPMFLQKVSYTDKVYRNFIKEMNAFTRQQRHQTPK